MSFPGKLLTFKIKTQITWTMATISVIAVLFTYIFINLVVYQKKEELLKNYMEYYYTLQNEIFKSIISFQNSLLFNYEDTLHFLVSQLVVLMDVSKNFTTNNKNAFKFSFQYLNDSINSSHIYKDNESNIIFFNTNYNNLSYFRKDENNYLKTTFRISNIFKIFRIPYYGDIQLFDEVIVYLNETKTIYSTSNQFLYEFINNEIGNDDFNHFYNNLMEKIINCYNIGLTQILSDKTIYPEIALTKEMLDLVKNNKDIKLFAKYSPFIDYKKKYLYFMKIEEESNELYLTVKLKSELIDNIFLNLMEYFDVTTLLLSPEDNTILNNMSCQALLIKLQFYFLSKNSEQNFGEILEKNQKYLKKNVTFDKCIPDNENMQQILQNYLKQNNTIFYQINSGYNSSFVQLSNEAVESEYMSMRYSYPDYFLLEMRQPLHLISNYLNIYSFMNFYFPFSFVKDKQDFYHNKFLFLSLIIWIMYIFIFLILFSLGHKIIKDITDPLIKLKKAIEQMSFNDETIFEYKNDDNINELFIMCKELVSKTEISHNLKEQYSEEIQNKEKYNIDIANSEDDMSLTKWGVRRNFTFNNQFLKKNRKFSGQTDGCSTNEEIVVYNDFIFRPKTRPRTRSKKRPNIVNTLLNQKYDHNTLKKKDSNSESQAGENFLRDSFISNNTNKKTNNIFLEPEKLKEKEKENKLDYELNILIYELLFCLGKNMFQPSVKEEKKNKRNYLYTQKLMSNAKIIRIYDSSNDIRSNQNEENIKNKYYNYDDPIYESKDNVSEVYNEEKISNKDQDKDNKDNMYRINFQKNILYYKYLKMKNNSSNNFLKNMDNLNIDRETMEEIEKKNENVLLLQRKNIRRKDSVLNIEDLRKDIEIANKNNLKRSIAKNDVMNKKMDVSRRGISVPINDKNSKKRSSLINRNIKKTGFRSSVSCERKGQKMVNF